MYFYSYILKKKLNVKLRLGVNNSSNITDFSASL